MNGGDIGRTCSTNIDQSEGIQAIGEKVRKKEGRWYGLDCSDTVGTSGGDAAMDPRVPQCFADSCRLAKGGLSRGPQIHAIDHAAHHRTTRWARSGTRCPSNLVFQAGCLLRIQTTQSMKLYRTARRYIEKIVIFDITDGMQDLLMIIKKLLSFGTVSWTSFGPNAVSQPCQLSITTSLGIDCSYRLVRTGRSP